MYEFKYKEEYYMSLINEYWKVYENDFYKVITIYPFDENHQPLYIFNLEKYPRFIAIPKDMLINPNIMFTLRDMNSTDHSLVRVFINFERSVAFSEMKDEQDEWLDAYETVFELDNLIRKLYPGHKILNDDEVASHG